MPALNQTDADAYTTITYFMRCVVLLTSFVEMDANYTKVEDIL